MRAAGLTIEHISQALEIGKSSLAAQLQAAEPAELDLVYRIMDLVAHRLHPRDRGFVDGLRRDAHRYYSKAKAAYDLANDSMDHADSVTTMQQVGAAIEAAVDRGMQRASQTRERLVEELISYSRMARESEQEAHNAQQLVIALLALTGDLRLKVETLARERDRLLEHLASMPDAAEGLARVQQRLVATQREVVYANRLYRRSQHELIEAREQTRFARSVADNALRQLSAYESPEPNKDFAGDHSPEAYGHLLQGLVDDRRSREARLNEIERALASGPDTSADNSTLSADNAPTRVEEGRTKSDNVDRSHLIALARRYAFTDLAALVAGATLSGEVSRLCSFGQSLLDLSLGTVDGPRQNDTRVLSPSLRARARASRMPYSPKERFRGALRSLRPTYALLLEVIEARWLRGEMAALVSAVHMAAEYLPMLAWEPILGHASDPAFLSVAVSGEESRFGVRTGTTRPRDCFHTRPEQSAAERSLRVAREPGPGWRTYLNRQHSMLASALCTCVVSCRTPCSVITRLTPEARDVLTERCRLAREFAESSIVRLRHAAPVGHGFGVPYSDEVSDAWNRTRASLGRLSLGQSLSGEVSEYPLPGLPEIFSAIAGCVIVPDTLLLDISEDLIGLLNR